MLHGTACCAATNIALATRKQQQHRLTEDFMAVFMWAWETDKTLAVSLVAYLIQSLVRAGKVWSM